MIAPDRVAFTIFGIDVMWYGILIGIGFVVAASISYYRAPKHSFDPDFIIDLVIWMIPCAIVGARGYYVLFTLDNYKDNWSDIFLVRDGGLAIHGALILCFIVAFLLCRRKKQSFIKGADLVAVAIPLAQAIGRWGNFFNQEAHGGPTDLPWAQIIDGVGYHPTFLYESIWCFLLFWFLLWFDNKKRTFDGQIFCLYMILYSVERLFVEGLRTDSLMIGSLRQAQLFSLFLIVFGSVLYALLKKNGAVTAFLNTGFVPAEGCGSSESSDVSEMGDDGECADGADEAAKSAESGEFSVSGDPAESAESAESRADGCCENTGGDTGGEEKSPADETCEE